MAKRLAAKKIEVGSYESINSEAYIGCNLIPFDKNLGVRPIGIGKVICRIIGKSIIYTIKLQFVQSTDHVQLCAGQQAGFESAMQALSYVLAAEETDAVLLVDVSHVFNSVNRKVMLHDIKYICPAIATYAFNCYVKPRRLFLQAGKEISSSEGATQDDPISMPLYAIAITPVFQRIKASKKVDNIIDNKFLPSITDGQCLFLGDRKLLTLLAGIGVLECLSFKNYLPE